MTAGRTPRRRGGALAAAVRRSDWEFVALCALLGALDALRSAPPGTIDDLLALLEGETDDARR